MGRPGALRSRRARSAVDLAAREHLVADVAGFTVPVRQHGKALSSSFRTGRAASAESATTRHIDGQWIQAVTVTSGARTRRRSYFARTGAEVGEAGDPARRSHDLLSADRAWRGRPRRNLFAQSRAKPRRVHGRKPDRAGWRYCSAGRNPEGTATGSGDLVWPPDSRQRHVQHGDPGKILRFQAGQCGQQRFYPRGKSPERYRYVPPVQIDDGWPVSTLEQEGIDREAIEKFIQKLIDMPMDGISSSQIHSVLIARHGKLVLEEYFHGFDRDTPHDTRSAAKSWTNVLIGAAMQSGVPIRLDTPVYQTMLEQIPADLDPRKKSMTLEHLISMTAGFDCDDSGDRPGDEDPMQEQTKEPNWYRYSLNVPMAWNSATRSSTAA